jgi:hypothetical protein
MGMSIVASFVDRIEAQVAAGALCSAGFNAVVMDQNFASVDWMAQQALGGIRVGVPDGELEEAAQLLRELNSERPEPGPEPHPGGGWRGLAIALGVIVPLLALAMHGSRTWWQTLLLLVGLVGTPLAWIIVAAAKSRNRQGQVLAIAGTGAVVVGALILIVGLIALISWLPHLLYPNGRV